MAGGGQAPRTYMPRQEGFPKTGQMGPLGTGGIDTAWASNADSSSVGTSWTNSVDPRITQLLNSFPNLNFDHIISGQWPGSQNWGH